MTSLSFDEAIEVRPADPDDWFQSSLQEPTSCDAWRDRKRHATQIETDGRTLGTIYRNETDRLHVSPHRAPRTMASIKKKSEIDFVGFSECVVRVCSPPFIHSHDSNTSNKKACFYLVRLSCHTGYAKTLCRHIPVIHIIHSKCGVPEAFPQITLSLKGGNSTNDKARGAEIHIHSALYVSFCFSSLVFSLFSPFKDVTPTIAQASILGVLITLSLRPERTPSCVCYDAV